MSLAAEVPLLELANESALHAAHTVRAPGVIKLPSRIVQFATSTVRGPNGGKRFGRHAPINVGALQGRKAPRRKATATRRKSYRKAYRSRSRPAVRRYRRRSTRRAPVRRRRYTRRY